MDSLEKLFLSCLVLFGMFILFLFGLYFDLGDMLASQFHRDEKNATGVGITENLIAQMEAHARPHEIMPTNLDVPVAGGVEDHSSADEMTKAAMRAAHRGVQPLSGKQLTTLKRANLMNAGVQREEVLEMESLAVDRDEANRLTQEATRLAGEQRFAEAAKRLGEGIAQVNPKNFLVLRDLLALQMQCYLDGKQVDKARDTARKLYDTLDRIVMVRQLEGSTPQLEQEIALLKGEKERLDALYAELQKRMEETGSPTGTTAAEKATIRESFNKARNEGKMTEEDYQRALRALES